MIAMETRGSPQRLESSPAAFVRCGLPGQSRRLLKPRVDGGVCSMLASWAALAVLGKQIIHGHVVITTNLGWTPQGPQTQFYMSVGLFDSRHQTSICSCKELDPRV